METQAPSQPDLAGAGPSDPKALRIGDYVSQAIKVLTAHLGPMVLGYLIVAVLVGAASLTVVGGLIIAGPLVFGYLRLVDKCRKGESPAVGSVFDGFQEFKKALITVLVLLVIFIILGVIGVVMAFIPCVGQVVMAALSFVVGAFLYFVFPIAVFTSAEPVQAVKASFEFTKTHFGPMLLLSLVTSLTSMAGAIACGIGLFFTIPLGMAISLIAYQEYYLANAAGNA